MTRVLVAYATKMGSTREIAEAIGVTIATAGHEVTVLPVDDAVDLTHYDAVVLGSALYMTRWRPEAVSFLHRFHEELAARPVWLFHSGPLGRDADEPRNPPAAVARLASVIGAEWPVTFAGRIEAETARGFLARRMAKGPLAGDYRDWAEIHEWARDIARALYADGIRTPPRE